MSYVNKTVSVYGDEKTFIKEFVQQLTSVSDYITCDDDIDALFSSGNIKITIKLESLSSTITLIRDGSSACSYYNVSFWTHSFFYSQKMYFSSNDIGVNDKAARAWKFTAAINDNVLYVALAGYNIDLPAKAEMSIIRTICDDYPVVAYATNAYAFNSTFYVIKKSIPMKFADRLNYETDDGKVEIIKNKALLNGTNKVMDFTGLYDCSTMPKFLRIEIDGSKYFVLDTHTLMPI